MSALREVALALEGNYGHYYMGAYIECSPSPPYSQRTGFYIHSCIKMRYKGTFFPSYLLGEPVTAMTGAKLKRYQTLKALNGICSMTSTGAS